MEKKKKIIGAINYMLILLSERFTINSFKIEEDTIPENWNFVDILKEANKFNDFGFKKTSLIPFLLIMAETINRRSVLLDFFTDLENGFYFMPSEYGIVNSGINLLLEKREENLCFETNKYTSVLKFNKLDNFKNKEMFEEYILNEYFEGNDENQILSKIKYNIEYIHNKRKPYFANCHVGVLGYFSSDSLSYRLYINNRGIDDVEKFYSTVKTESFKLAMDTLM